MERYKNVMRCNQNFCCLALLSEHMNRTDQIRETRREERLCELMRLFAGPCRGPLEAQLQALKERLLQPALAKAPDATLVQDLSWAANEAAALAWYSGYPMLLLPGLLEEKLSLAHKHWERQQEIWHKLAA